MWAALACALLAACGRIGFTNTFDTSDLGDGHGTDTLGADDGSNSQSPVMYVGAFAYHGVSSSTSSDSFSAQAQQAGDTIILHATCQANAAPPTLTVTAPGWTFTQSTAIRFDATLKLATATMVATAPDTNAVTVTVDWTPTNCNMGVSEIADELVPVLSGPLVLDPRVQDLSSGPCTAPSLTTGRDNEALWAACFMQGGVISDVSPGFTRSPSMAVYTNHWSAYKLTTAPAGTAEPLSFSTTNFGHAFEVIGLAPQ